REDKSNASVDIPRNRVRHELLPYLEEHFNPGMRRVLVRSAALARSDDACLTRLARQAYEQLCGVDTPLSAELTGLAALDDAIASRVVRMMLHSAGRSLDVQALHVEQALRLARAGHTGQRIDVGGGYAVVRDARALTVLPPADAPTDFCVAARLPGTTQGPAGVLVARSAERPDSLKSGQPLVQWADADKLGGAVFLRTRRAGDSIHPLGAPGNKKLKDYFIDKKVAQRRRADWPLLCRAGEVLWAIGLGVSHSIAVDDTTKRVLRLEYRPAAAQRNTQRGED
ncbi:MAG: tRNA lysidine(34) synthetase TilS, partial [Eubacteriales bacterium]|nr:tRNA lysidine(34) synthetase TilS [Eubacteriales bacterium]